MTRSEIEYGLRREMSDIAPNLLDELLEACDNTEKTAGVVSFTEAVHKKRSWKSIAAVAAMLAVVFSIGLVHISTANQRCTLTVDVNPSIELCVNGFYNVKGAQPCSDDAAVLYEDIEFDGMKLDDAMGLITERLCENGYITGEHNGMLISVNNPQGKHAEELCDSIVGCVADTVTAEGFDYAVLYQNLADSELSSQDGVSDGRAALIEKLENEYSGSFTEEELSGFSTQELIILSCRLEKLPVNTEFFGSLKGYCNSKNAELIAIDDALYAHDCPRSSSLIKYGDKLAYEVIMSDGHGKIQYYISAVTGEILNYNIIEEPQPKHSDSHRSGSGGTSPANPIQPVQPETKTLSTQQILDILMNLGKISIADLIDVVDDMSVTSAVINGQSVLIVTYELNDKIENVVINPAA